MFMLILTMNVSAIGLGTVNKKEEILAEPGVEQTVQYIIFRGAPNDKPQVYPEDAIKDVVSIKVSDPVLVKDNNFMFEVTFRVKSIKDVSPGVHYIYVSVKEGVAEGSGGIAALTAARTGIKLRFAYPGKYVASSYHVMHVNVNQTGEFHIVANNYGTEDISNTWAEFKAFDRESGEEVFSLMSDRIPLSISKQEVLKVEKDTVGLKSGIYDTKAILYWDDEQTEFSEDWKIGDRLVYLKNYTNPLEFGKVNKFKIGFESLWNTKIEDLYAVIFVDGNEMLRTPPITLDPWASQEVQTYFDTTGLAMGNHQLQVDLRYAGVSTSYFGEIGIVEERVPELESPLDIGMNLTTIVIVLVVLFILGDIIWLIMRHKNKKNKENVTNREIKPPELKKPKKENEPEKKEGNKP